jgi:hypothetical protein
LILPVQVQVQVVQVLVPYDDSDNDNDNDNADGDDATCNWYCSELVLVLEVISTPSNQCSDNDISTTVQVSTFKKIKQQ